MSPVRCDARLGERGEGGGIVRVAGLDLSLSATGIATNGVYGISALVVRTKPSVNRYERLRHIRREVMLWCDGADLVVLEDQPTHTPSPATLRALAELHGVVGVALWEAGVPVARVNVSSLKRYATGKGVADKADMALAAYKTYGFEGTADEVDAYLLAAMGLDWLGTAVAEVSAARRAALDKVIWPEGVKG